MNVKSQKGFTGIDITIAIIVIATDATRMADII